MKKKVFALLAAASSASIAASIASATQVVYDPFNYDATGSPALGTGPSSAVGTLGQWIYQGNNTVEPRLNSGSLSYTGLATPVGNKVQLDITTPTGADASRLYLGTIDKATVPTLYYSFVTSLPTSASSNQNGAYFAGLDNLSAGTAYTTFAGLFVRQDAGSTADLDLGISTSGSANKAWTTVLPHDVPLFVVASFNFQGLANLDVFTDPAAIPLAEPGAHSVTSTNVDASVATTLNNFYLRGNSGEPQHIQVDEVRVGTTWADVAAHAYYWDVDGATAGPGGAAPAGNWDGAATNFNSDATGGGAGFFVTSPTAADSVDFSAGTDATGSYTVTVSNTQAASRASIKSGNVTFGGTGTLAVATFDVAAGATATVNTAMSGSATLAGVGGITKSGAGTLTLGASALTYTGNTTVSAGTLSIPIGNLTSSANVKATGGTLQFPSNGTFNRVIKTGSVSVSGGGKINIDDNKMILTAQAVGTWNGTAYTGVTGVIASGYSVNQDFSGSGIVTTQTSATGGNTLHNIGVASNADLALATFGGQSVSATDTLVMFTYGGDANLDGAITGDDYFQIDSGFPAGAHGWFNGDFNYDGSITGDDYFVIDSNFSAQGAPIPTSGGVAGVAAVPEPGAVALFAAAAATAVTRRRRRVSTFADGSAATRRHG